jgi:apolipoprotein D and lipocalin family protein
MRLNRFRVLVQPFLGLLAGCGIFNPPLDVVESVDLTQYAGKWYEIASYPTVFEAGCTGTTAEYTLNDDGTVKVVNTCNIGALDGPVNRIEGSARVADSTTNAKLKVTFFPPFEANYWIIALGSNYGYAVVGDPSRKFLWVLSRTPTLDDATYQEILSQLPGLGFDPEKLVLTLQPTAPSAS